jgi:hypothetical protein
MKRRQFLQFAGSAIATLGLGHLDVIRQGNQYAQVLAQPTSRKLALLVGINDYLGGVSPLRGCLTDIELQYELLVHRYGFNPQDILIVKDDQATRAGILTAFETHLINQARAEDVVVFHYSGHGSRVVDPDPIPGVTQCEDGSPGCNGTLVPHDGRTQSFGPNPDQVDDIMGRTLFLLMSALKTNNVTVVLDSCHSGGGTRGNVVVRSLSGRSGFGNFTPSPAELDYQERWRSKLGWSAEKLKQLRQQGIAKGVAIGSAQANQLATDAPFNDFHAGAFTYLLTRYLWQEPLSQPLERVFVNLARSTHDVADISGVIQDPLYAVQPGADHQTQPPYLLTPPRLAAEAVVREVQGQQVDFWLGGVSPQNLTTTGVFSLIDHQGQVVGEVEQTDRLGLLGRGQVRQGQPQPGMLLRERVRGVPANLSLRLGLDVSLGTEIDALGSALQGELRVEVVPANQQAPVDCLLGRMTEVALEQARQRGVTDIGELGSLGLLTSALIPVPGTFGEVNEPSEQAIARLRPRLKALLAGRILGAITNSNTSGLKVAAEIKAVGDRGGGGRIGSRGLQEAGLLVPTEVSAQTFQVGTEIQIKVQNQEDRNLYIGVLVIGSNGDLVVLHPVNWDSPETAALVGAGKSLTAPQGEFQFIVQGPSGFFELLILASTTPIRNALRGLQRIARGRGLRSGDPLGLEANEPVAVLDDLLGDLDQATRASVALKQGSRGVDPNQLAALSTIVEVVE